MADVNDDGTLPFRSDAYIDKDTGMYTVPEPKENTSEFELHAVEGGKSIWAPVPKWKPCRRIQFITPFAYLDVVESLDNVRVAIHDAKDDSKPEWFQFIDPTYGTTLAVRREVLRDNVAWIIEAFVDIEAVEIKNRIHEMERLQAKMAIKKGR